MKVELLYFEGCPHWTVADERLAQALTTLRRDDITVERRQVETTTQAEEFGFTGSPTIRVDGRDPFATGEQQVGLACRVYSTPKGLSGSPTVEQLVEVLS
jgi:hypothetical protein